MNNNRFNIESFIGKDEKEVVETLKSAGFVTRVMHRDGESFFGTCDYRLDRYNLSVKDGKVMSFNIG